jgi:hypothetical protein
MRQLGSLRTPERNLPATGKDCSDRVTGIDCTADGRIVEKWRQ